MDVSRHACLQTSDEWNNQNDSVVTTSVNLCHVQVGPEINVQGGSTMQFQPVEELRGEHKYFGAGCLINQSIMLIK